MQFIQVSPNRVVRFCRIVDAIFNADAKLYRITESKNKHTPVGAVVDYQMSKTTTLDYETIKAERLILFVDASDLDGPEEIKIFGKAAAIIWEEILKETYAVGDFDV